MSMLPKTAAAAVLATALMSPLAQASVLFSDDFNADAATSALNFTGLLNWTVSDGTIDYIRSGGFGITCAGGSGGCLDMDGSRGDAGRITSTQAFTLASGFDYVLNVALSGNQRGGATDSVKIGMVNLVTGAEYFMLAGPLAPADPFTASTLSFTSAIGAGSWHIFVEGVGGDNVGAILDNVALRDSPVRTSVPEPATLLLAGLALGGIAAARRRTR